MPTNAQARLAQKLNAYPFGFSMPERSVFKTPKGLSADVVLAISRYKKEPDWMTAFRLKAYSIFKDKPMPTWGADLSDIDFDNIYYYLKPVNKQGRSWDDVPSEMKRTFDKLGIPEAEKKFLAGVGAQYDSEVIYHSVRDSLKKQGVIFTDMDTGLREYPEIVQQYFGKLIPPADNKFASLNSAVWSGGSFVYVPKGVHVTMPLQAYFRINAKNMGQFERTLIIAEEGSSVHYVEGCTAPIYASDSLHAAVVEIYVKRGARVRYTTIQNWSKDVYNLVTKRMQVQEEGVGEWIDGNLGSKVTMKYPSVYLVGRKAHGEVLSLAFAGAGQHQDAGGKAIHSAPETTSLITSKSISKDGGRTSYRGLLHIAKSAQNAKSTVRCDALILDPQSRSDTYPTMKIRAKNVTVGHEATVSKIGDEQLFYLRSRGLKENEASAMIVNGFVEPIVKELPFEYAVELNRLINLEMEGSVG
ncbi:MAG: Fe-S cluster assembly protein SufB [Candidatus Kerfeldbacteria bacterium]|nr:Fe-S cluster assembly protein SufB [Candidatus Kerfeldbacteria bacterium]